MPQVPLATRLGVYGISPTSVQLADLDVPAGQQVILRADDAKLSRQTVKLAHVYFFGCKLLKAYEPFWPLVTT